MLSRFRGPTLAITMADIRAQGMHSLNSILKGRGGAPAWDAPGTPRPAPSAMIQLMKTARARHLPTQIHVNNDQRNVITNELISRLHDNADWGHFADPRTAEGPGSQQN